MTQRLDCGFLSRLPRSEVVRLLWHDWPQKAPAVTKATAPSSIPGVLFLTLESAFLGHLVIPQLVIPSVESMV